MISEYIFRGCNVLCDAFAKKHTRCIDKYFKIMVCELATQKRIT